MPSAALMRRTTMSDEIEIPEGIEKAFAALETRMKQQIATGEKYTYPLSSPNGGVGMSRRGDLCDMERAVLNELQSLRSAIRASGSERDRKLERAGYDLRTMAHRIADLDVANADHRAALAEARRERDEARADHKREYDERGQWIAKHDTLARELAALRSSREEPDR